MAAIAGIISKNASSDIVETMLDKMRHRGPDSIKTVHNSAWQAGVRAAKLAVARGDGLARKGNITVLFDGEIYNERDDALSDAEVVLDLYSKYGRSFAGHLKGAFACAINDGDEVLLIRDSVGIRPLYVGAMPDGATCFASELKALVEVADDVWEMPPAVSWSMVSGIARYEVLYAPVQVPSEFDAAVKQVRATLTAAVKRRIDDGAVGACLLSGGLDSSIIACVAHELGADMPLITVGVEGAPDVENAVIVAAHLGMEHQICKFTIDDIEQKVPEAVYALESFDEDCVSGTISNLFASGHANKCTNCILSGEGGDELFGGYHLLKDLDSEVAQLEMMEQLIKIAYNTALQRLDRSMFANSINYRTPFIDSEVVALALQLPVRWKIHNRNGTMIEKYILREAFKDILPEKIYRREKLRFAAGTGTDDYMDTVALDKLGQNEFNEKSRHTTEGYYLNTPKELWYYKLFKQQFPNPCFERLVGRWDPGK